MLDKALDPHLHVFRRLQTVIQSESYSCYLTKVDIYRLLTPTAGGITRELTREAISGRVVACDTV